MTLQDVWIKKIGQHRGRPRLFLDGLQAVRAGFSPGERFDVEVEGRRVIIKRNQDGSRVVSSRKKGDAHIPVVDINSAELLAAFEGMDAIRVVVGQDRVFLLPLASQAKKVERVQRLQGKLASGQALSAGSVAHGGGVLAHAVHTGLRDAGIECTLEFANELRDDLLEQAIGHNDVWGDETAALALPMQEMAQDEWLLNNLPKLEVLEMGLPCSGASIAGHTKKGLQKMEDHEQVGHLVYSALVIISKTNPAVVLLENVPRYADTASASILRAQFKDMGYKTAEFLLDGQDFGALEKRIRWCMVATTIGVEVSLEDLAPPVRLVRRLGEVLDPRIGPDDASWSEVQYLKDKEARNAAVGDRFKMQFVDAGSTSVPTLRRHYNKGGSSDPRLRHPQRPELSRLLTPLEHAGVKGVPPDLIAGLARTTAHELLGQGIAYEPFRAVGERIGQCLVDAAEQLRQGRAQSSEDESGEQVLHRRQRITG